MLNKRQLALRSEAVGGSEIAVLAGLSRWATPIQVYEAKVFGHQKEQTLPMELGVELEEPIARVYAHHEKKWLKPVDSLINHRYPFAVATPDRAVFPGPVQALARRQKLGLAAMHAAERGLEVKSTTWRQKLAWGPAGTDQIAEEYVPQVTWCMGVTGLKTWDVAVLFDRDDFRVYHLTFNEDLFLGLYAIAERFMREHVIVKRPPPVDASAQYAEFLDRAWKKNHPATIKASPEMEELALELALLAEAGKRLEQRKEYAANKLKALIGEHGGVEGDFGKIYWRRQKDRTVVDHQAIVAELVTLTGLLLNTLPEGDRRNELRAQVASAIARHTEVKPGNRPLSPYWSAALKAELAGAPVALAPLSQTTQDNTQDNPSHQESHQ